MNIPVLGATRFPSPLKRWVDESERVPATILRTVDAQSEDSLLFELAGARKRLFFNPAETRVGIVTAEDCVPDSTMSSGRCFLKCITPTA